MGLTDGLYPEQMANGPDDVGYWKDRLPYVRHDLEMIEGTSGHFQAFWAVRLWFRFRSAGPQASRFGPLLSRYSLCSREHVEPRFLPVDPSTRYQEATGYGWTDDAPRQAVGIPLTPYWEFVRRSKTRRTFRMTSCFETTSGAKGHNASG